MKNTEMKEISMNEMEKVNGGAIFYYADYDMNCIVYEVIDDKTGDVMRRFYHDDFEGACDFADNNGMSCVLLTWDELNKLREKNKK